MTIIESEGILSPKLEGQNFVTQFDFKRAFVSYWWSHSQILKMKLAHSTQINYQHVNKYYQ